MLMIGNRVIDTNEQGYLKNSADWSIDLVPLLAEKEGIILTESHWEVIFFMRDFYQQYNTSPTMRLLVTALAQKFGYNKGNSRYLYRLFPKGSAQQASKIAGLPKPVKCL